MLYILNEITLNGYREIFLDCIYIIAIICGVLVIISKNPIVSVLFLIGLFLSISCYLIVRFCISYSDGSERSEQYAKLFPASELDRRESQRLNLASPQKGGISPTREG